MTAWTQKEKEAGRHLLWYHGYQGGYEPGGFSKALIHAMTQADALNRARLIDAFPEYRRPLQYLSGPGAAVLAEMLEWA